MNKDIILCTMCMVYDEDKILVENRVKKDWPGLTFPGGHVEPNETVEESCIRERKEETGLDVYDREKVGYIEWNLEDGRHLSILFRTNKFKGELVSSKEGKVFFLKESEFIFYPWSTDFDKILKIMKKE